MDAARYDAAWYEERCANFREVLLDRRAATAEEIAGYWPGGAENALRGLEGWIYCYGNMVALLWRTKENGDPVDAALLEQTALDMMRDKPQPVELVRQLPDGRVSLNAYPKSPDTITLLDEIEAENRWCLERIQWLQHRWEHEAVGKLEEFLRAQSELDLLAAWIATTEGVGSPFSPAGIWPPVPEWCRALDALDIVNLMRAYQQVNAKRIELLAASLRPRDGQGRALSWATLKVRAAEELHAPLDHLEKTRSLASWFAQFVILVKSRDDAVLQEQVA